MDTAPKESQGQFDSTSQESPSDISSAMTPGAGFTPTPPPQQSPMRSQNPSLYGQAPVFEAPQQAPREITVGDIHTMPEKFMSGSHATATVKGPGGKKWGLIIVILVLVLGGLTAGAYFYLQQPGNLITGTPQETNTNTSDGNVPTGNTNEVPGGNTNQPAENPEAAARDEQRLADIRTIAEALEKYYEQFESYPQFLSVIPREILAEAPVDPSSGAPYTYTPRDGRQSYSIVFDIEQGALLNDEQLLPGPWEVLPSDFGFGPDEEEETVDTTEGELDNLDADGDGLTAAEERTLGTSIAAADSDSDGFRDNIEVQNFYSPVQTGAVTLDQEGIVELYTNTDHNFSLYHPSEWLVRTSPGEDNEILITIPSGEDIVIQTHDNPQGVTAWEWYSQNVSFDFNRENVDFFDIAGTEAVRTLDGLEVYVADESRVFSIVYRLNSIQTINYPNLFDLILDRLTLF